MAERGIRLEVVVMQYVERIAREGINARSVLDDQITDTDMVICLLVIVAFFLALIFVPAYFIDRRDNRKWAEKDAIDAEKSRDAAMRAAAARERLAETNSLRPRKRKYPELPDDLVSDFAREQWREDYDRRIQEESDAYERRIERQQENDDYRERQQQQQDEWFPPY